MDFDLDQHTARLSVGEFADFTLGPRDAGGGSSGLWRAQIGTQWHRQLRTREEAMNPGAEFEVAIAGKLVHRGWTLEFNGRIDQLIRSGETATLREIKTVTRPLPDDESALRGDYPGYFVQLAAYAALMRQEWHGLQPMLGGEHGLKPVPLLNAELVFVEPDTGLVQTVSLTTADEALFRSQLERICEFLDLRLRARERLRGLRFRPPFAALRPGQEAVAARLQSAVTGRHSAILFEAPTGFGKTGVLLEVALGQLQSGHFDRVVYLTGKSTGQLQVVQTLAAMTQPEGATIATWQVRPKSEHCVNHTFHCVRAGCTFLDDIEARWPQSGLARFYLFERQARDLETLRAAGVAARICPYEITRAALAFNDVWIGDFNYVFAPANRGLFEHQPGYDPARTLLIVDEAHNLPSRVADAHSHVLEAAGAAAVLDALPRSRTPARFLLAWEAWMRFLNGLEPAARLEPGVEDEARDLLAPLADLVSTLPLEPAVLGPQVTATLWQIPALVSQWDSIDLPSLWWCPREGALAITCLDAAAAVGAALGAFGGVVLASATPGPVDVFAEACGVPLFHLEAETPWREGAYDVACDLRVDTTFQQRALHYATTADTVATLARACANSNPLAVFFPSHAYAEAIARELGRSAPDFRAALQPRRAGLSAQAAWIEASLAGSDALFLVLGSSFAESIDLLGGRVTHAMVVGPALPEVNAVQRARLAALAGKGREAAFRRVYQIPGMQKVNQALGRLVRAPGQHARVLLHCRRFGEPGYAALLAPDLRPRRNLATDSDLASWLE